MALNILEKGFRILTTKPYQFAKSEKYEPFCVSKVVFYWDQPFLVGWVGWVLLCSIGEKPFLVGLVDQPFQPALNRVETVEKAFA